MKRKKLPKGLKKHIRKEKARIRQDVLNSERRKLMIQEIYNKILKEKKNED